MTNPINLEIGHFKLLISLAEHGTLSRVALALGLSQPAASYRLKEIERRVGAAVVERRNNKYRLNLIGERLLDCANIISSELQRLQTEVESLRKGITRTIRVSTHAYNCTRWLAPFLKEFRDKNEHLGVELVASSVRNPLQILDSDISDVVIVAGEFSGRRARCYPLFENELVGVIAPDHPFANREYLVGEDFRGVDYVTYSTTHEPGFEGDRLFRPSDLYPGTVIRAGDSDSVLAMVEAGFGVSVLGHWAVQDHEASHRLISKKLTSEGLFVTWNALSRHREIDDGLDNFCTSLADWCRREM